MAGCKAERARLAQVPPGSVFGRGPGRSILPGMATIWYSHYDSPIGRLLIAASEHGLMALEFAYKPDHSPAEQRSGWIESREHAAPVIHELEEYFASARREFTVPLDLHGTDFQRACWQQLRRIPYGETRTYLDIAEAVSSPGAVRAVGQANHYNPVAIIVPCHRVINTTGKLGGYGGGLDVKAKLLRLEGADVAALADSGQEALFG